MSSQGGRNPRWAHGGRELYFVEPRAESPLWVVTVEAAAGFAFRDPVLLFESPGAWSTDPSTGSQFDITLDNQRFLIARRGAGLDGGDDGVVGPATVLVNNFFEELRRLVP